MSKSATIYTYPWDFSDEGIDQALETIAGTRRSPCGNRVLRGSYPAQGFSTPGALFLFFASPSGTRR